MKKILSLTPLRCLLMVCLLTTTVNVAMASYTPSTYSTTWTTDDVIYLYNKATGLYLSTDGRWGTEGMLKSNGMPVYLSKAGAGVGHEVSGVTMYSSSARSDEMEWGLLTSTESYDPVKQGLFCDASKNYTAQTFKFTSNSDGTYSICREGIKNDNIIIKCTKDGTTYYLAPSTTTVGTLLWSTVPYFWAYDTTTKFIYAVTGSTTKNYLYHEDNDKLQVSPNYSYASTCYVDVDGYLRVGASNLYLACDADFSLSSGKPTYTAKATDYATKDKSIYLAQQGGDTQRKNIVTGLIYSGTDIPDAARWYIVTKADMIADFAKATASDAQPKEATFYIANPDFSRTVDVKSAWTISSDNNNYAMPYTRLGNSLYNSVGPIQSTSSGSTGLENSETGELSTFSLADNGSGYTVTAADVPYAGIAAGETTYYHAIYGGYYNCRMLSNGGTGEARSISQKITGLKAGYYKVSCDGYTYNPSGATGVAKLYAKTTDDAGKSNSSVALVENDTYQTMTQAGIDFYNNGETSKYRSSVLVYVADGADLELGVSISGGIFSGDAKKGNANTFAEIDGFKLEYTGNPTYDIVLDETKDATSVGSDLNYIDAQVETGDATARTLYLQRSMKENQWNSIVLPVSISAGALKSEFGEEVELVEFNNCTANTITFTDVNIDNDATTAIEAGKCYLIKPSALNGETTGEYATNYTKASGSISVTASEANPVYIFNQVTLTNTNTTSSAVFTPTGDESKDLQFQGTYFKTTGAVTTGSYAINAADGNWYRWEGTESLDVLGFRTWIGANDHHAAKLITLFNDEEYIPTEVEGVAERQTAAQQNGVVYNINGVQMGTAKSFNKLPAGMYILNGKKFIVK